MQDNYLGSTLRNINYACDNPHRMRHHYNGKAKKSSSEEDGQEDHKEKKVVVFRAELSAPRENPPTIEWGIFNVHRSRIIAQSRAENECMPFGRMPFKTRHTVFPPR